MSDDLSIEELISDNTSLRNQTYQHQLPWYRHNLYIAAVLTTAYGLVFIAGLIGNVLVIFAVFRGGRSMMRVSNIFLANLAIADLLVIIACLPFTLVSNIIYRKSSLTVLFG